MSKILFLNPPFSLEELYGKLAEGGSELPPLGIALLAAVTRKEGYNTKILDAVALKLDCEQSVDDIIKEKPRYLAITSTTISIFNAARVVRLVKRRNKGITTIIGGPHLTAVPEETMGKFPEFDIGVIGEAEETIVELLNALENDGNLEDVKGLIIRGRGKLRRTGIRLLIKDLDKLPFPAWDLLPDLLKYYQPAADSLHRSPATLLITSRGCPGQCLFCDRKVFGNLIRGYSARYVVGMVKYLQKHYGIKDLFIEDDNFLVFKKRTKEICDMIIKENIDISFSIMGRVDVVDMEILKLLKKAGCWQINYGLESGSQKILDILNKGVTVEENERAVRVTKKAGIKIKGLFMMGNFGETRETIKETLNFIKRVPMDDFHITCFTPLPGADAWELAPKYGEFDPDWKKVGMFEANNFVPRGFTKKELEGYYKKAWTTFYLQPRIIWYYLKKLKNKNLRRKIIRSGLAFLKFTTS